MTALATTFGYQDAVPDDALAAWGARLIVAQDGRVDFAPDRHGAAGEREHQERLFTLLDERFPVAELRSILEGLLRYGHMQTREAEPFVLHQDDELVVVANTNGSGGYCYVLAWVWVTDPNAPWDDEEAADHVLGSGATTYSWWRLAMRDPDGTFRVEADDPAGGPLAKTFTADDVNRVRQEILAGQHGINKDIVRDLRDDPDANAIDCLLQVLVFGEVVYG